MTRGEIYRIGSPRRARGHEQSGARYGVVVQADELLPFNTVVIAPTSASALEASFRPVITISGTASRVLAEKIRAVDIERLGRLAGRLDVHELRALDEALSLVLGL